MNQISLTGALRRSQRARGGGGEGLKLVTRVLTQRLIGGGVIEHRGSPFFVEFTPFDHTSGVSTCHVTSLAHATHVGLHARLEPQTSGRKQNLRALDLGPEMSE